MDRPIPPMSYIDPDTGQPARGVTITLRVPGTTAPLQVLHATTKAPVAYRTGPHGTTPAVIARGAELRADTERLEVVDPQGTQSSVWIGRDGSAVVTHVEAHEIADEAITERGLARAADVNAALTLKADKSDLGSKASTASVGAHTTRLDAIDAALKNITTSGGGLPIHATEAAAQAAVAAGATMALYLVAGGGGGAAALAVAPFTLPAMVAGTAIAPVTVTASTAVDEWIATGLPAGLSLTSAGGQTATVAGTPLAPQDGTLEVGVRAGTDFSPTVAVPYTVGGAAGAVLLERDWTTADQSPYVPAPYSLGGQSYAPTLYVPDGRSEGVLEVSTTATEVTLADGTTKIALKPGLRAGTFNQVMTGRGVRFPGLPGSRTIYLTHDGPWSGAKATPLLWDGGPGKRVTIDMGAAGYWRAASPAMGAVAQHNNSSNRGPGLPSVPYVWKARAVYSQATDSTRVTVTGKRVDNGAEAGSSYVDVPGDVRTWTGLSLEWNQMGHPSSSVTHLRVEGGDVA